MVIFNKITNNKKTEVTDKQAQEIFDVIKVNGVFRDARDLGYSYPQITLVMKEAKLLEAEMVSKMNGSFISVDEVSHTDEEGIKIIDTPKKLFVVTTETSLINSMSSDSLDITKLVSSVRAWNKGLPDEKNPILWGAYKESFVSEK